MNMRSLTDDERTLIANLASGLGKSERAQLLQDLQKASAAPATPDGSRVVLNIAGYDRPPYRGQHPFGVEGRMLDSDNTELSGAASRRRERPFA